MAFRFAVPDQLAAVPLFRELESDDRCELVKDTPARVGVRFSGGGERFDAALITPLDYARHGGSFRILPGIGVSANGATGSCRLRIRRDVAAVRTLAADLRSTYDLAIATLLLREKYHGIGNDAAPPTVIPVQSTQDLGFDRSDAVLDCLRVPVQTEPADFSVDVYEEWMDMTEAPLVLLLWVVRDTVESIPVFRVLADAFQRGTDDPARYAEELAAKHSISAQNVRDFFDRHRYGLSFEDIDAIDSLFRVAYSYGMLGDIPDIHFLEPGD